MSQGLLHTKDVEIIRLDLTTEVFAPIKIGELEIGHLELQRLGSQINEYIKTKKTNTEKFYLVSAIAEQLQEGNLSLFTREISSPRSIIPKDQSLVNLAEETFGQGSISNLYQRLSTIPDYDTRLLLEEPKYLLELGLKLKELNLEYAKSHLPHLVEEGGMQVITSLANRLIQNDLKSAIALRMNEGDKMRNCSPVSDFIRGIFGCGFRLLEAYQAKKSNTFG